MSDWDQRQLCPDGSCTGVIGSDGTCKVCGRAAPNWGNERTRGLVEDAAADDDDDDADEPAEDKGPVSSESTGDPDWDARKLCPDGACTGVIADDGKCNVCGRSAA